MPLSPANSHGNGYPLGLTGATAATRYVGGTTSGAPASGTFAVGDYVVTEDGGIQICTVAGSPGTWVAVSGGGGLFSAHALYQHVLAQNTDGGTATGGSWQTHPLNTETFDPDGIGSLASNQVTLGAGTYYCEACGIFFKCGKAQVRLRDTTNSATLAVGSMNVSAGGDDVTVDASLFGRFTLSGSAVLELQYQVEATRATDGLGAGNVSFGENVAFASLHVYLEA